MEEAKSFTWEYRNNAKNLLNNSMKTTCLRPGYFQPLHLHILYCLLWCLRENVIVIIEGPGIINKFLTTCFGAGKIYCPMQPAERVTFRC